MSASQHSIMLSKYINSGQIISSNDGQFQRVDKEKADEKTK